MGQERGISNLDREGLDGDLVGVKRIHILRQLIDEPGWPPAAGHTPPEGDSLGGHHHAWYRMSGGPFDPDGYDDATFAPELPRRTRSRLASTEGRS